MEYRVVSLYKYAPLENPDALVHTLRRACLRHNILGRILISKEGINAAFSGTEEDIEMLKVFFKELFPGITFREQSTEKQTYHKLVVRARKEVVVFGESVDVQRTGDHIPPEKFKQMLDNNEDIVIVDTRNEYETAVGKFKNAITLPIKTFKEFPKAVPLLEKYKDKKIVMYCTAGIRCEKASAYLKQKGFKNVNQLEGGIINYINKFPNDNWEGACFVFDNRLAAAVNKPISVCVHCKQKTDAVINCHNLDCDILIICCSTCKTTMKGCCSEKCKNAPRHRKEKKKVYATLGVVENYYAKQKVVQIKVMKDFEKGMTISFKGKHTELLDRVITEMRSDSGETITEAHAGQTITIPLTEKVRKNDRVVPVI